MNYQDFMHDGGDCNDVAQAVVDFFGDESPEMGHQLRYIVCESRAELDWLLDVIEFNNLIKHPLYKLGFDRETYSAANGYTYWKTVFITETNQLHIGNTAKSGTTVELLSNILEQCISNKEPAAMDALDLSQLYVT